MKLLEGIERREWWIRPTFMGWEKIPKPYGDQRNAALNVSEKWEEFVDPEYVNRLERMLAKAVEQRDWYREKWFDDVVPTSSIEDDDAELRAEGMKDG